jgi:prevent-host-death family protein
MEVNIHEAKTHLSRLLQKVSEGEEVIIARAGVPVARLVAVSQSKPTRPLGIAKGEIWMADDFDAPMPEFEALFYDSPITSPLQRKRRRKKQR